MKFVTAVFILSFCALIVVDVIDCSLIAGNEDSVNILFAFVMIASSVALMIFNGLRLCCMASLVLVRFVEGIDCVIVGIDVLSLSVVGSSKAKFSGVEFANIDL
jgi:hypothetical protein